MRESTPSTPLRYCATYIACRRETMLIFAMHLVFHATYSYAVGVPRREEGRISLFQLTVRPQRLIGRRARSSGRVYCWTNRSPPHSTAQNRVQNRAGPHSIAHHRRRASHTITQHRTPSNIIAQHRIVSKNQPFRTVGRLAVGGRLDFEWSHLR